MKKLFLASQAKHPKSIEKLKEFIGEDYENKHVVYIPTAANGELYGSWKGGGSLKAAKTVFKNLTIAELESTSTNQIIKLLENSDLIWMAGGYSGYLLYWLRRLELDKYLPEILDNGVIYIGSSAGSMVCARTQYSSELYFDEPGTSVIPGLSLIDFEILPHYQEDQYDEIKKKWIKGDLCLLKDGEVVTVVGDKVEILGEERFVRK